MQKFISILLLTFSLIGSLFICELIVRGIGRYSDQANLNVGGSNKIWERSPLGKSERKHPDLDKNINIFHGVYGSRVGEDWGLTEKPKSIGVFGDSFTENRRIEADFAFTTILNRLSENTFFWNFGVDGYGLEQSFQQWLDKREVIHFDAVFYVFCSNDIRNTYEAQIFDRKAMEAGQILNIVDGQVEQYVRFASKMHTTYLIMEAFYKFMALISPNAYVVPQNKYEYSDKLGRREYYNAALDEHNQRFHDPFSKALLDEVLNGEGSKDTKMIISHFQNVLRAWKAEAELNGQKFFVLVLPRPIDRLTHTLVIPGGIEVMEIANNTEIHALKERPWEFENDGHWNEYGNIAAAASIANRLPLDDLGVAIRNFDESEMQLLISRVDNYYATSTD